MQHQAARGGEHFGLTNGFKRSGPLSKQCMILFGMNYMLLCAQSIQGATTVPEFFLFHCDNSTVVCKGSTCCYCREFMTLERTLIILL